MKKINKKLNQAEIKSLTQLVVSKINKARDEKWVGKRMETEFPKLYKLQQAKKAAEDKFDKAKSEITNKHSISFNYWSDGKISANRCADGLVRDEIIIANLGDEIDVDKIIAQMVKKFG